MPRWAVAVVIVALAAGALAWTSRGGAPPFVVGAVHAGADITDVAQAFPGGDRTMLECTKRPEGYVECYLPWSAVDGQILALVDQDHHIRIATVVPRWGYEKLAEAATKASAEWQRFPHGPAPAPFGELGATRWTSRDGRWSALVAHGRLDEDVPDALVLVDEKRATPAMRARVERYLIQAALSGRTVRAEVRREAQERLLELADDAAR